MKTLQKYLCTWCGACGWRSVQRRKWTSSPLSTTNINLSSLPSSKPHSTSSEIYYKLRIRLGHLRITRSFSSTSEWDSSKAVNKRASILHVEQSANLINNNFWTASNSRPWKSSIWSLFQSLPSRLTPHHQCIPQCATLNRLIGSHLKLCLLDLLLTFSSIRCWTNFVKYCQGTLSELRHICTLSAVSCPKRI